MKGSTQSCMHIYKLLSPLNVKKIVPVPKHNFCIMKSDVCIRENYLSIIPAWGKGTAHRNWMSCLCWLGFLTKHKHNGFQRPNGLEFVFEVRENGLSTPRDRAEGRWARQSIHWPILATQDVSSLIGKITKWPNGDLPPTKPTGV